MEAICRLVNKRHEIVEKLKKDAPNCLDASCYGRAIARSAHVCYAFRKPFLYACSSNAATTFSAVRGTGACPGFPHHLCRKINLQIISIRA
jgi:hypothetical protein